MAFVKHVGSATSSSSTTIAVTIPGGGVASGNFLAVRASMIQDGRTISSVVDSRSNTYSEWVAAISTDSNFLLVCQVATTLQSGDTITITWSGKADAIMAVDEWDGLTLTEDGENTASGNSTTPSAGFTPGNAVDLIFAHLRVASGSADSFTEDADSTGGASWSSLTAVTRSTDIDRAAYKITTSAAAQTYDPTLGTTRAWYLQAGSLQSAGGSPYAKTGAAAAAFTGSGADAATWAETGAATSARTGAGADAVTFAEAGTAAAPFTSAGADALTAAETGTATAPFTGAAAETVTHTEAGAAVSVFTGSAADTLETAETGTAAAALTGSGSDVAEHAETGAAAAPFTGSGISATEGGTTYEKTGAAVSAFAASGADTATHTETAAAASAFTGSAADAYQAVEAGAGTATLTAAGTASREAVEAGTAAAAFTGSASDTTEHTETGTGAATLTGTGADTAEHAEAGTGTATLTGNGSDVAEHAETGTAAAPFTGSGPSETGGAATYEKTGAAAAAFVGSGADTATHTETGTAAAPLTGGAADAATYHRSNAGQYTREARTLDTGEVFPHALLMDGDGRAWLSLRMTPAKLIRFNDPLNDLTDETTVTFADSTKEAQADSVVYIAAHDKVYASFKPYPDITTELWTYRIAEINAATGATATLCDYVTAEDTFGHVAAPITTDGTYLYLATCPISNSALACEVVKIDPSDGSIVGTRTITSRRRPHSAAYDADTDRVYLGSGKPTGAAAWAGWCAADLTAHDTVNLATSGTNIGCTDDSVVDADWYWVGIEGAAATGIGKRISKDLATIEDVDLGGGTVHSYGAFEDHDPDYLWFAMATSPGQLRRVARSSAGTVETLVLPAGENEPGELVAFPDTLLVTMWSPNPAVIVRVPPRIGAPFTAGGVSAFEGGGGTTYEKTGAAAAAFVASGADAAEHAETGTAAAALTTAGTAAAERVKAGAATAPFTGSAADAATSAEAGTAAAPFTGSAADTLTAAETGTATIGLVASGVSSTEDNEIYEKTGAAAADFSGSGSDTHTAAETGTAAAAFTGSAAAAATRAETGTAVSAFVAAASSSSTHAETGTAAAGLTGNGTDAATHTETGTGTAPFTGSGTDAAELARFGAAVAAFTAAGTSAKTSPVVYTKTGTAATLIFTGRGWKRTFVYNADTPILTYNAAEALTYNAAATFTYNCGTPTLTYNADEDFTYTPTTGEED